MYFVSVALFQFAFNVTSEVIGVSVSLVTFVPVPGSPIYQPSKTYPTLVGLGNVMSLYVAGVQFAVNVPFPAPYVYVVPVILPAPVKSQLLNSQFAVTLLQLLPPLLLKLTV